MYRGAVRVYPPKMPQNPYQIKLYFPATIQKYNAQERNNGPFGSIRFANVLVRATLDRRMWPAIMPAPLVQPELKEAKRVTEMGVAASAAMTPVSEAPDRAKATSLEISDAMSAIVLEARRVEAPCEIPQAELPSFSDSGRIDALSKQVDDLRIENERLQVALENANDEWVNATAELERLQAIESPMTIVGVTEEDQAILTDIREAFASVKQMIERTAAAEAARQQLRDENEEQRREINKLRWTLDGFHTGSSEKTPERRPP